MGASEQSLSSHRRIPRRLLVAGKALLSALGLAGCQLATPFTGIGYDRSSGVTLPGAGDTVVVGVTHAVLDASNRAAFDDYTRRVIRCLPGNDGYIGSSVRSRVFGHEVWTMTVWRDEAALEAFVRSDMHNAAMREGLSGVARAQFMRLAWPTDAVPPRWDEILKRLEDVAFVDYRKRAEH
jgi:heme-degrading monooxygenase HmoA